MSGSALFKTYLVRIHLRHAVPIELRFVDPNKAIAELKTANEARQRQSEVVLKDDGATELHCNGVDIVGANIVDVANETELAVRMAADIARTRNAVLQEFVELGQGNLLGTPGTAGRCSGGHRAPRPPGRPVVGRRPGRTAQPDATAGRSQPPALRLLTEHPHGPADQLSVRRHELRYPRARQRGDPVHGQLLVRGPGQRPGR